MQSMGIEQEEFRCFIVELHEKNQPSGKSDRVSILYEGQYRMSQKCYMRQSIVGHVTVSLQGSVNYIYESTAFDFQAVAEWFENGIVNIKRVHYSFGFVDPVHRIDID